MIRYFAKWATWIVFAYALLSASVVLVLFKEHAYDDPFITYRYAANLASGNGFVYNLGEHILSTTTPLFTLLLACIAWLSADKIPLPLAANIIGAASLATSGVLLWRLGEEWKTTWVGWSGLLLYPIFPLGVITLGSETSIYITFCLAAILLYTRRYYSACAGVLALAVLTRPDGILLASLLAGHYLLRVRKPIPWRAVLVFGILTGIWALYAWGTFGSPLPVTLLAKQSQVNLVNTEKFAPGILTILKWYDQPGYWLALGLAVFGILGLSGRGQKWLLVIGWTGLYFLGYSLLGVSRYFWYYAPLVPGFLVMVGLGISALYAGLGKVFRKEKLRTPALRSLLPVILLIALILVQVTNLWNTHNQPDQRYGIYKETGQWLAENTPEDSVIGTLETGIIGYYAQRRMVDFAGLLFPDVPRSMTEGSSYEDSAIYVVQKYHPDYLVLPMGAFPDLQSDYVAEHCQAVNTLEDEEAGLQFVIYNCR